MRILFVSLLKTQYFRGTCNSPPNCSSCTADSAYLFTYLHSDAMAVFGFFSENFLLAVIGVDYVIKLLRTDVQRTRAVRRQVPLISTGESFDVGPMT